VRVSEHLNIDLGGGTELDDLERALEGNRKSRMEMVRQAEPDQREIVSGISRQGIVFKHQHASSTLGAAIIV
jgi:hypothetical protein